MKPQVIGSSDKDFRERFWRQLVARYHARLCAYSRSLGCSPRDVHEIAWDTWDEAIAFEVQLASVDNSWPILKQLARRLYGQRRQHWQRERPLDADAVGFEPVDQFEELETQNSSSVLIERLLEALPAQQRLAVDFRCRWGWPYWAVAAALETSEVTARVHVARGLQRLRQLAANALPVMH